MWIAMLVLTGFLLGGVFSFARNRRWGSAGVLTAAALLSGFAAYAWLPQ